MTEHTHHHDHYVHGGVDHYIQVKGERQPSFGEMCFGFMVLLAIVIVFALAINGHLLGLLIFVAYAGGIPGAIWLAAHLYHKRKNARDAERERLRTNADREHKYVQHGDDRGVYGEYPVPDSVRGTGIWLADRHE